jgi:hypothetical protein
VDWLMQKKLTRLFGGFDEDAATSEVPTLATT